MSIIPWDRASYDQDRYETRKAELIQLLGGRCASCGSDDKLEFDHVDPSTKSFSIMARWNAPASTLSAELAKCQLLCEQCHLSKTVALTSVDHGGGVSGKKNCKCDPCRARKNEYMRAWKAARKARARVAA